MKLLAVVAIGVVALFGSPVLTQTYSSIGNECGIVKESADRLWYWFKEERRLSTISSNKQEPLLREREKALFVLKDPEKTAELDKQLEAERATTTKHYKEALKRIREISHFAQVYSAFCK